MSSNQKEEFLRDDIVANEMIRKFEDSSLNELFINGIHCMQLKYFDRSEQLPSLFSDNSTLLDWVYEFSDTQGARLDPHFPANGGFMSQGGFRWHAVVPPLSPDGAVFCLRRSRFESLELLDFDCSVEHLSQVFEHLEKGLPIIVCGSTGTGKSSFLCALLKHLYLNNRVVILESINEIPLLSKLWIKLVAVPPGLDSPGVSLDRALSESLRLSPERYVVGELRGNELLNFLSAIETGHFGGLTTLHATDEHQVMRRLNYLSKNNIELRFVYEKLALAFMKEQGNPGLARFTLTKDC